jgi:hypothetical protein
MLMRHLPVFDIILTEGSRGRYDAGHTSEEAALGQFREIVGDLGSRGVKSAER